MLSAGSAFDFQRKGRALLRPGAAQLLLVRSSAKGLALLFLNPLGLASVAALRGPRLSGRHSY
jgi:hypothetical protein